MQHSENVSLKTNSTDITLPVEPEYLGAASSCINDIANDDFPQILNIQPPTDEDESEDGSDESETAPIISSRRNSSISNALKVPQIRMTNSDNSISHVLDAADGELSQSVPSDGGLFMKIGSQRKQSLCLPVPDMKQASSDVSISHILDRDNGTESFDENNFASVNANKLSVPVMMTPSTSDVSISFILDEA